jgi:opacity protein-like surface antigen
MKITITKYFAVLFLVFISGISSAQNVRINLYSAYTFDDEISAVTNGNYSFSGTMKGGYQWGAGVEFLLQKTYGIELLYFRQDTKFPVNYRRTTGFDSTREFGLGGNFIMLAGNKYLPISNSVVMPYGGFMLGMSIFNNKDPLPGGETSSTNFAWGLRGGVFINASKNVGVKLHAQLLSAVQSFGTGMYYGTGYAPVSVSTGSSMLQFGLGGALVIGLGK